jgi:hypothetical protein
MKQIFTLLLLTIGMFAKSTPTKPEPAAVKAFEATYGKQASANWTCTAKGCAVQFELKGQIITAVYSHAGKLRWYEKHILSTQLPVALQMTMKNYMGNHWISDVKEQSGKTGTVYTVTMENASSKLVLTNNGNQWLVTRKSSKA